MGGRAVHARAGARDRYAPVQSAAGWPIESGDARRLAEIYRDVLGISEIYVADLDAILERHPQEGATRSLAALRAPLWLDAGVRSVDDAQRAVEAGASRVIVALETLPSFDVLAAICDAIGNERVAFSLDLRDGKPIVMKEACLDGARSPEEISRLAVASGTGTLIVIDLARVGTGRGIDLDLLESIRSAEPGVRLVAGGGVRGWNDLVDLARAGCHAALVATALHNGTISSEQIATAATLNF